MAHLFLEKQKKNYLTLLSFIEIRKKIKNITVLLCKVQQSQICQYFFYFDHLLMSPKK